MKVSIIIPFYSEILWLGEAVQSVLDQTFKDYEIIVINDGSPEDDTDFLKQFGHLINYFKTDNFGAGHARNYGIEKSTGEYLAFLDSDDKWGPKKLELQLDFMERCNSVWSSTNYYTFRNETGALIEEYDLKDFSGNIFPQSLAATHIATPSIMIRSKEFKEEQFRFQEKMRLGQDYFLWLTLSQKYRLDLVPFSLLGVRVRGTNAAIRARAHIQVRADIWRFLKDDKVFRNVPYAFFFKSLYWLTYKEHKFLQKIEKGADRKAIEFISKVFYFPIYISFKTLFKLLR